MKQRIANLPSEQWTPEVERTFPIMLPEGSNAKGSDFNSILVLAHHPEVSESFLRFNTVLARGVELPPRLKEIAILRTAWRCENAYEWGHHMLSGLSSGLSAAHYTELKSSSPGRLWTGLEQAIIEATDAIIESQMINDALWARLMRELTTKQVMELLYVVGCYTMLASILNCAGTPIEAIFAEQAAALDLPPLV